MFIDKALELVKKQAITASEIIGKAVKIGLTEAVEQPVVVVTGDGLEGGTGVTVDVYTDSEEAMSNAEKIASFTTNSIDRHLAQFKMPYGLKEYVRVNITPVGSFSAGEVEANVAWGPEL